MKAGRVHPGSHAFATGLLLTAIILLSLTGSLGISAAGPTSSLAAGAGVPLASSAITVTADGALLLVVNPDSNSLTLVDVASHPGRVVAEIVVGVDPRSVAVSPDGTVAFVVNRGSDSLSVVNLLTASVEDEIDVGDRPQGVALSPDGRLLAIAELGDDRVRIVRTAGLTAQLVLPVGDRPHGLSFTPDGKHLLVSHLHGGEVTVLPVRPHTLFLPLVLRSASTPPSVYPHVKQRPVPRSSPQRMLQAFLVPTWPHIAPAPAVVVNSAGTRAYLPQTMANGQGLNIQFDTTVFPKVSVLDLSSWSHETSEHIPLPETDQPVGLPWDAALARDDTELWVVNAASNDVSVVDISAPSHPRRVANIPVGDNPRGIAMNPERTMAYVNNTLAGTVSVIDTSAYTVTSVISVTDIPLPPTLLHGKRLFHSSAQPALAQARWIACSTCHIEAEQDGRTWLLQFTGPLPPGSMSIAGTPTITRNTTSLLGMVETYPLRWSAEWNESADSEFSIRFEQFGTGLIHGEEMNPPLGAPNQGRSYDLDCLAAFLDGLAVPPRVHALTPAELRGKVIFESPETGCLTCHPAPLYTDLQAHNVGTADAPEEWFGPEIDTPTLRFLYDSPPYLHDGRAPTLLEVLTTTNPNDEHGVTSHLSEAEVADLISFLLALPYQE